MPDPSNPEGQPQGDPVLPPTNPTPPPTDPTPAPSDSGPGDSASPEKLKAALESERALRQQHERDAKAKAKELEALKAEKQQREDAEKSDAERAIARAEAAEKALAETKANLRSQAVRHAVASAARDLNFHKPDDAFAFIDLDAVEFDDAGSPKGIPEMVAALAKERDYLVKPADAPRGPQPTPRANGNGQTTADEQRELDRRFAVHTRSRF